MFLITTRNTASNSLKSQTYATFPAALCQGELCIVIKIHQQLTSTLNSSIEQFATHHLYQSAHLHNRLEARAVDLHHIQNQNKTKTLFLSQLNHQNICCLVLNCSVSDNYANEKLKGTVAQLLILPANEPEYNGSV